MDKTRVDDIIIQMITPKISEIEKKFSDGEGLTQDDINTLLLKSQYNHINHLDDKLNEVTASVVLLENKFDQLKTDVEGRFEMMEGKFELLKTDLEGKFGMLEGKFELLKTDLEGKFEMLTAKVDLQLEKFSKKIIIAMSAILTLFLGLSEFLDFLKG